MRAKNDMDDAAMEQERLSRIACGDSDDDAPEYVRAFREQTAGLHFLCTGIAATCRTCQSQHGLTQAGLSRMLDDGLGDEGSFSRLSCDTCGSGFGGNRYAAHARIGKRGRYTHLEVCEDCLFYINNGDVPEDWRQHP